MMKGKKERRRAVIAPALMIRHPGGGGKEV